MYRFTTVNGRTARARAVALDLPRIDARVYRGKHRVRTAPLNRHCDKMPRLRTQTEHSFHDHSRAAIVPSKPSMNSNRECLPSGACVSKGRRFTAVNAPTVRGQLFQSAPPSSSGHSPADATDDASRLAEQFRRFTAVNPKTQHRFVPAPGLIGSLRSRSKKEATVNRRNPRITRRASNCRGTDGAHVYRGKPCAKRWEQPHATRSTRADSPVHQHVPIRISWGLVGRNERAWFTAVHCPLGPCPSMMARGCGGCIR